MKKICFVLTTPFAVNAFLLGHFRALADYYHVSLCVNCSMYPISPLMDPRVRIIDMGIQRKMSPLTYLRTLWELICLFRRMRFDAVHSMTPKAGLLAMLAAWVARVPRRYHSFTGQIWANKSGFGRFFFKRIDRLIVLIASRVFADSASQCHFLEAEGVADSGEVSVLGFGSICGVDLKRFRPDDEVRSATRLALHATENTIVFLFAGRLVRDKGAFDLIIAFAKLVVQHENVALWIIGPDEDGLLPELK
ncbi:MAG: glycosyltransferase, partial [Deltaproteobacteria bacterium]|nr:glycosyltransferase [Deltaproteobacteria bacterium]